MCLRKNVKIYVPIFSGRQQSPVNISPDDLVYDPKLGEVPFQVDKQPMSGSLHNTGQLLVFKVDPDRASKMPVNITGGPLSYRWVSTLVRNGLSSKRRKKDIISDQLE